MSLNVKSWEQRFVERLYGHTDFHHGNLSVGRKTKKSLPVSEMLGKLITGLVFWFTENELAQCFLKFMSTLQNYDMPQQFVLVWAAVWDWFQLEIIFLVKTGNLRKHGCCATLNVGVERKEALTCFCCEAGEILEEPYQTEFLQPPQAHC